MSSYIFDTNAFRVIEHYYPDRFSSFWERFVELTRQGRVVSVREVLNEIRQAGWKDYMQDYFSNNEHIFKASCSQQLQIVTQIMTNASLRDLVRKKQWLSGTPVADPFLVAAGKVAVDSFVISQENGKMPQVCSHFSVNCAQVREMMTMEGWVF